MKKVSALQAVALFAGVFFLTAMLFQCRKTGDLIKNLDRSYTGGADSTVYASFYESNTISTADATPDVNDIIRMRGVQTIIGEYCGTSNCHGGAIKPGFDTYADIMKYVVAGNPEGSKLWEFITTNDFDRAMPPVNSNHELTITDKKIIYNWIKNGAREKPDLNDFRPAVIRLIRDGCASANCHNQTTAAGAWARKGLIPGVTTADTATYTYINPITGSVSLYCQMINATLKDQVWGSYKDSVKRFYADTVTNASYRPFKTFSTPWVNGSPDPGIRGPLTTYDDIIMDIMYPKSIRSSSSVVYTDPVTLRQYYVRGNPLAATDCFIRRMDSTLIYRNPLTLVETTKNGTMAYDDGGFKPSEVALFKAWYFADPNIPDVWKYGVNNVGIFKYRKSNNYIIRR